MWSVHERRNIGKLKHVGSINTGACELIVVHVSLLARPIDAVESALSVVLRHAKQLDRELFRKRVATCNKTTLEAASAVMSVRSC